MNPSGGLTDHLFNSHQKGNHVMLGLFFQGLGALDQFFHWNLLQGLFDLIRSPRWNLARPFQFLHNRKFDLEPEFRTVF